MLGHLQEYLGNKLMPNKAFTLKLSVAIAVVFIGACSTADESPDEVFREYRRHVAAGLTFEEEMSFYSSRNRQQIESRIAAKEPTIMTLPEYLAWSSKMSRCTEIKITDESVSTDVASLTYDVTKICEDYSDDRVKLQVRLVREYGWKIDEMKFVF